jgi:hypothetical protein
LTGVAFATPKTAAVTLPSCAGDSGFNFIANYDANSTVADDTSVTGGDHNESCDANSTVGGGSYNYIFKYFNMYVGNPVKGSNSFLGGGEFNGVRDTEMFVGGGANNHGEGGQNSAIFGGTANAVYSYGDDFIGAGTYNSIEYRSGDSVVLGGFENYTVSGEAVIAGGYENTMPYTRSDYYRYDGFIGGGSGNRVLGTEAVVTGGQDSVGDGEAATIPGGDHNEADGKGGFAAGFHAYAQNDGDFVWADEPQGAKRLTATQPNEFLVRATGGAAFLSNTSLSTGAILPPGSGSWSSTSDRGEKYDLRPADRAAILEKIGHLPVTEWSYRSEPHVRHIGPMAQDFHSAFFVGADDRHLTTVDEDGVVFAAAQALHAENSALGRELRYLHVHNAALGRRLSEMESSFARFSHR